ncbi:MAG: hypothetical protein QOG20_4824 [Pseudonocardiales bacterium]|jgi:hypothetical protein|nr:hypothetical protein [Pseudonocardiales bacterium]
MRLILDIDLDRLPEPKAEEASRILRYRAGALSRMDVTSEVTHQLTDSAYAPVGELRITRS